jgi:UDP-N-acetylmuramyl pentapeptide phosphotransferase/UDP-N-acetylglucosamine-1-phosphate transferase
MSLWPIVFPALCAAVLMPLAIRARVVGRDADFEGIQKVHEAPTSRLGGVIVVLAYVATLTWAMPIDHAGMSLAVLLAVSSLPVVLVGLSEDITGRIRPWHRLAASVVSAAFASWLVGGIIARLDLPVIDGWLKHLVFVLPLTWFMVAGACNAMNIIDGAHGLAGGTALMMFAGLAVMAGYVGDSVVLAQGARDGGRDRRLPALELPAWQGIPGRRGRVLPRVHVCRAVDPDCRAQFRESRPGSSSPGSVSDCRDAVFDLPAQTGARKASMQPDAEHLHSLIFRWLASKRERGANDGSMSRVNARVAPHLWLHGALCLVVALVFYNNTPVLIAFSALYGLCYVACYRSQVEKRRLSFPAVLRHRVHAKGSSQMRD